MNKEELEVFGQLEQLRTEHHMNLLKMLKDERDKVAALEARIKEITRVYEEDQVDPLVVWDNYERVREKQSARIRELEAELEQRIRDTEALDKLNGAAHDYIKKLQCENEILRKQLRRKQQEVALLDEALYEESADLTDRANRLVNDPRLARVAPYLVEQLAPPFRLTDDELRALQGYVDEE